MPGMAWKVTGVTRRSESSILELREITGGVAIAASVRKTPDSSCRSDLRSVDTPPPQLCPARVTYTQLWPIRPRFGDDLTQQLLQTEV